jgi:hypothetical protein
VLGEVAQAAAEVGLSADEVAVLAERLREAELA